MTLSAIAPIKEFDFSNPNHWIREIEKGNIIVLEPKFDGEIKAVK